MTPDEEPNPKALTKNPLGACGEAVAANVERLRDEQNLTFALLSHRLEKLGRPIPPLGLRKIVARTRRVDVDDLVGLALALGTSPSSLLMPSIDTVGPDDEIEVTGAAFPVAAKRVWEWLTAQNRISRVRLSTFADRSWPVWVRGRYEDAMYDAHQRGLDELTGKLWPSPEANDGDN